MRISLFLAVIYLNLLSPIHAAEAPAEARAAVDQLMGALVAGDHGAFVAGGDTAFRGFKKEPFDAVSAQLAPLLKKGYETTYLGDLKQKGYAVTLWKFSFKDGSDDLLGTLSLKDGKIGGFWIK